MPEQEVIKVSAVKINTGFEFVFMEIPIQTVYEHSEFSDQILIILADEKAGNAKGRLKQFFSELQRLFTELEIGGSEEIQNHVNSLLAGTGVSTGSVENANDSIADKIELEVKQFFIHITKPDKGNTEVEYAFGLKLTQKNADSGIFKIFSLDSLTLNIWNVSSDSKIYKKMDIKTIEDLLK